MTKCLLPAALSLCFLLLLNSSMTRGLNKKRAATAVAALFGNAFLGPDSVCRVCLMGRSAQSLRELLSPRSSEPSHHGLAGFLFTSVRDGSQEIIPGVRIKKWMRVSKYFVDRRSVGFSLRIFVLARTNFRSVNWRQKSTFCHPEQSEGSAFILGFKETADSSGKPRPSE
jgi:hypothetical protein